MLRYFSGQSKSPTNPPLHQGGDFEPKKSSHTWRISSLFTKTFAAFLIIALIFSVIVHTLYHLNQQNIPSLQCLTSLFSRCNVMWSESWLAGVAWHTCKDYCTNCRGSSYGVCTRASLQQCFDEVDVSTKCYCYGHEGNRNGWCWY